MKLPFFLTVFLLTTQCFRPSKGDDDTRSDTHPDLDHYANTHPDTLIETHADADIPETHLDTRTQNNGHPEDTHSDWYYPDPRPKPHLDSHPHADLDSHPNTNPDTHTVDTHTDSHNEGDNDPTHTHSVGEALMECGEHSSELTANGQCRLMATLPPMGLQQKRCPDIFRCTDEVYYWQGENQSRREQIEDLRETISEQQEELRNHRHRIMTLEMQTEERSGVSTSLDQRFRSLQVQYTEVNTLLHVHGALLHELQTQLHKLSETVERVKRSPGCMINMVRTSPLIGTQEALHPEVQHLTNCPIDCASLYYNGVHRSGVYTVVPLLSSMPVEVYCDMETEGGGWTLFQRRQDGKVNFNRSWQDYREGFGELRSEHWLGNEHIHHLSTQGEYSLRIDLEDWTHKHKHALYQSFSVEGEQNRYRLHVSGFSGTAEDSFGRYHDKRGFSTPDTGNICAEISHAGWWYHQCFYANLNGVYYKGGRYSSKGKNLLGPDGIVWYTWKDSDYYSLKRVSMMMRPRTFRPHHSP